MARRAPSSALHCYRRSLDSRSKPLAAAHQRPAGDHPRRTAAALSRHPLDLHDSPGDRARVRSRRPPTLACNRSQIAPARMRSPTRRCESIRANLKKIRDSASQWESTPWLDTIRLMTAAARNDHQQVLRHLGLCRSDAMHPIELQEREACIGNYHRNRGNVHEALAAYSKAQKASGPGASVDIRARTAFVRGTAEDCRNRWRGKIGTTTVRAEEATKLARQLRCFRPYILQTVGLVHGKARTTWAIETARISEAARVLRDWHLPPRLHAKMMLHLTSLAVRHHCLSKSHAGARKCLRHIARFEAMTKSKFMRAHCLLLRAQIIGLGSSNKHLRSSLANLDMAESLFETLGDGLQTGTYRTLVERARIYANHGDQKRACASIRRAIDTAHAVGLVNAPETVAFFNSQLLLFDEASPNRDDTYDEILHDLHSVRCPESRFRIVSNLYLYTWTTDRHFDLHVRHLDQIRSLESELNPRLYHALYDRYVAGPVLRRAQGLGFGSTPLEPLTR